MRRLLSGNMNHDEVVDLVIQEIGEAAATINSKRVAEVAEITGRSIAAVGTGTLTYALGLATMIALEKSLEVAEETENEEHQLTDTQKRVIKDALNHLKAITSWAAVDS